MKKVVLIISCFFFFSCSAQNKKDVYIYENDTIKQTVKLSFVNENKITFQLISENILREQSATIEGVAISNDWGMETDDDDEGYAYAVTEYIHEGDCWLSFRIDMETQTTMRIIMADCVPNPYCPFTSVGILKSQRTK